MGQTTSIREVRHRHPIFLGNGIGFNKITMRSIHQDVEKKVMRGEDDELIIESTPLAKFTQNTNPREFPFLLNCRSAEEVHIDLSLPSRDDDPGDADEDVILRVSNGQHEVVLEKTIEWSIHKSSSLSDLSCELDGVEDDERTLKAYFDLHDLKIEGKCYISLLQFAQELFTTSAFLEHDEQYTESEKPYSKEDEPPALPTDNPKFRRSLSELEHNLSHLKSCLKFLIKKSQALDEATRNIALVRSSLSSQLFNLSQFGSAVGNDLITDLVNEIILRFTEQSTRDIQESNKIANSITMPLITMYNSDLGSLSSKQRHFHDLTSQFYSPSEDANEEETRQRYHDFELARFDYFQYLNEFTTGYAMRKLLFCLSEYFKGDLNKSATSFNTNLSKATFLYRNHGQYRSQQQELRNALVHHIIEPSPSIPIAADQQQKNRVSFHTYRDPRSSMTAERRDKELSKSGVFYTLGGRGKSGWHKQLISLSDNLLSEYVDYKNPHKLRNAPIDITFACIKNLDTLKDRRYCIEIITPRNVKRLFQLNSEAERDSWVQALIKGAGLKADDNQYNQQLNVPKKSTNTVSQLPNANIVSLEITDDVPSSPLALVQDVDPSNRVCCDCGGTADVEWISLNLLVVVCIACSGVHRSLGSHISKIRSLTLDDKVFATKEMNELLYHVSNKFANAYLENGTKIKPDSSDENRRRYITDKYVKKLFLLAEPSFNANDALIKAVHSANVPLVQKALAYGANTSMIVIKEARGEKKEVTLFEYSLTHCHGTLAEPIFDVSELLVLNNTPTGDEVAPALELNKDQKLFWASKIPSRPSQPNIPRQGVEEKPRKQSHTGKLIMRSQSMLGKKDEKHKTSDTKSKRTSRFKMLLKSNH
jgi:Arf-GAP/SH3 domain/ANK repeat/PH domain-containing protein